MLAPRVRVAMRAASQLPITGAATVSLNSAVPFGQRRWKSAKANNTKAKDVKALGDEEELPAVPDDGGTGYTSTQDGQRMKAGTVHLIPHKTEPNACVFVITGEEEYLFHHKGTLDPDGKKKRITVPAYWLRDNCQCPACINPTTRQKTLNTFNLNRPQLQSAVWEVRPYKRNRPWSGGIMPKDFLPDDDKGLVLRPQWDDGHVGEYSKRFIRKLLDSHKMNTWGTVVTWDNEIYNDPAHGAIWGYKPLTYQEVMNGKYKSGMFRAMDTLTTWGVTTIEESPTKPEATKKLLEEIGPIRNTHYGGFYDFTANLAKNDTAYTNEALDVHTDTTYFTEPASLQAFHVLSHTDGKNTGPASGGETILADGIRAAVLLEKADPQAFEVLCRVRIPWYSNGNRDACIKPDARYPVIERHPESGEISRIRWNNADRGVVPLEASVEWYNAARKFHSLVTHPSMQLRLKLKPGTILITNNWRVLHGRTAFTGDRRVCGGYISRDDFESRWRLGKGTNDYMMGYILFQDAKSVSSKKAAQLTRATREKYGWFGTSY